MSVLRILSVAHLVVYQLIVSALGMEEGGVLGLTLLPPQWDSAGVHPSLCPGLHRCSPGWLGQDP